MVLFELLNIMCVDVILVEYDEDNPEGKELEVCHSLDIPKEYYNRTVMNIFPVDDCLRLLLEPKMKG